MARLWSRKKLSGPSHSSYTSSGRRGRLSSTKINDNDDGNHVDVSSLELEEILEEIGNTVETLPWDINLSSSEDGNTESCIVLTGDTEVYTMHDVEQRHASARLAKEESEFEMSFCHVMDVIERGLPHCFDVVTSNATEGIFPVDADKYQGVQSIGSLHSM